MKRAIIFDFGGVLMKTVDHTPRLKWDERLGLPHGTIERTVHNNTSWIAAQSGKIDVADYWRDVATQLHIPESDVHQLAQDFYSGDALDMELVSMIRQYRAKDVTVALLSNDSVELTAKLARLKLDDLFNPCVISAYIGVMKPNPAAYQAVLQQLNRPAQETIFIDDRQENIEGALQLGIHGIHYVNGMDLNVELAKLVYT